MLTFQDKETFKRPNFKQSEPPVVPIISEFALISKLAQPETYGRSSGLKAVSISIERPARPEGGIFPEVFKPIIRS